MMINKVIYHGQLLLTIVAILLLLLIHMKFCFSADDSQNTNCDLIDGLLRGIPAYYTYNGSDIPSMRLYQRFTTNSSTHACTFDVGTQFIPLLRKMNSSVSYLQVIIVCPVDMSPRLRVIIKPQTSDSFENVVGNVRFTDCDVYVDDVDAFFSLFYVAVVTINNSTLNVITERLSNIPNHNSWLKHVSSLIMYNTTIIPNISSLFMCQDSFPILSELILGQMGLQQLPDLINLRCPNLQSLALMQNSLEVPVTFPWTNKTMVLPKNLSRSALAQSDYADPFGVVIAQNVFQKTLQLEDNHISTLSVYKFVGNYDRITLDRNRLREFGVDTFVGANATQVLTLTHNELSSIPKLSFVGLIYLRRLILSYNEITSLTAEQFSGLNSLVYLGLDHNFITDISDDAFSMLISLGVLDLRHNKISTMSHNIKLCFNLNTLKLSGNPLMRLHADLIANRYIKRLELSHTLVDIGNLNSFVRKFDKNDLAYTQSSSKKNMYAPADERRLLDLSSSNVTKLTLPTNISPGIKSLLTLLLRNFIINLKSNPILCDCDMQPLRKFLKEMLDQGFEGVDYYAENWICFNPSEFRGIPIVHVTQEDMFSLIYDKLCPYSCTCYRKCISRSVIIDCRRTGLTELPSTVPLGKLELWFQKNNITILDDRTYLNRTLSLDISENKLYKIDKEAIHKMSRIKKLNIATNALSYLPPTLASMNDTVFNIVDNVFECDCHSLWLKNWIIGQRHVIVEWQKIRCKTPDKKIREIVLVADQSFTCPLQITILYMLSIILPASIGTIILVSILVCVYLNANVVKLYVFVFLNIRLGRHDKVDKSEIYSVYIVYPRAIRRWVRTSIIAVLEEIDEIVIFDIWKSPIAGLSNRNNVELAVSKSRYMMCVISEQSLSDENCSYALSLAKDKCKKGRVDYLLPLFYQPIEKVSSDDKFLKTYAKAGHFMTRMSSRIKARIEYHMPCMRVQDSRNDIIEENQNLLNNDHVCNSAENHSSVFISHSYQDMSFVNDLCSKLGQRFTVSHPFKDFRAGDTKQNNIMSFVESPDFVLVCLSNDHAMDEWTLFTFNCALQKCLSQKHNKLIIILRQPFDVVSTDDVIARYIGSHECLLAEDKQLIPKLLCAFEHHSLV